MGANCAGPEACSSAESVATRAPGVAITPTSAGAGSEGAGAAAPPASLIQTKSTLLERSRRVRRHATAIGVLYSIDRRRQGTLHQGERSMIFRAEHVESGVRRAVKERKKVDTDLTRWHEELDLLEQLDHPHVSRLIETFEDGAHLWAIMELCVGRSLMAVCSDKVKMNETTASVLCQHMVSALGNLHEHGICHAALSPECFLFTKPLTPELPLCELCLKLVDLGRLARIGAHDDGKRLGAKGHYKSCMAPEQVACNGGPLPSATFSGAYDIHAVGSIAHFLLSNTWPAKVQSGSPPLEPRKAWHSITYAGQEFVTACLAKDQRARPPASALLVGDWLASAQRSYEESLAGPRNFAKALPTGEEVFEGFREMNKMNDFERAAINAAAYQLPESSISHIRLIFQRIDKSGDGRISLEEMCSGLEEIGAEAGVGEIIDILKSMDTDGSGMIEYTEFIAAAMAGNKSAFSDEACKAAFKVFDEDGSGTIDMKEIREKLGDEAAQSLIEADTDGDGTVSIDEFKHLIRGTGSKERRMPPVPEEPPIGIADESTAADEAVAAEPPVGAGNEGADEAGDEADVSADLVRPRRASLMRTMTSGIAGIVRRKSVSEGANDEVPMQLTDQTAAPTRRPSIMRSMTNGLAAAVTRRRSSATGPDLEELARLAQKKVEEEKDTDITKGRKRSKKSNSSKEKAESQKRSASKDSSVQDAEPTAVLSSADGSSNSSLKAKRGSGSKEASDPTPESSGSRSPSRTSTKGRETKALGGRLPHTLPQAGGA
eukprot:TRINITY_DN26246_c0_g1_i1.p1 TRINITY_DN26246_c0_g1~~TRINITY_DN26246_c0_g1_i1.p1  ORF type:complete len:775 (-),score=155.83 TRINITY_DN26246_c0_g1_i1:196-2520(-)